MRYHISRNELCWDCSYPSASAYVDTLPYICNNGDGKATLDRPRDKGKFRLLIMDGHGSHFAPGFDRLCSENGIIATGMPPHSSHLLQPLDECCFAPLKRVYGEMVEAKARCNVNHIDKLDFLEAFSRACAETFKPMTIQNAFEAAGLVPYDPGRVTSKLDVRRRAPYPHPLHR